MQLVRASGSRFELETPRRKHATILIGGALIATGFLPLAGGSGAFHLASALVLFASGAGLLLASAPRGRRAALSLEGPGTFKKDDGSEISLSAVRSVALGGSRSTVDGVENARYRAEFVLRDGLREVVLERDEPAGVLRDLAALLRELQLPVESGWGLPRAATPWNLAGGSTPGSPGAAAPHTELVLEPESRSAQSSAALALLLGGVLLGAILLGFSLSRSPAAEFSALSIALPALSTAAVLLLSALVHSQRLVVSWNGGIRLAERLMGVRVRTLSRAEGRIRAAWPVSPDGKRPLHVLVDCDGGPLAVPCRGEQARALVDALTATIPTD